MKKENKRNGYLVYCGSVEQFFSDAASAVRYAAFMEEVGYDAFYYDAHFEGGRIIRDGRVQEHVMRECVRLGL